jgi:uncharacterized protein (DUF488 family)
MIRTSNFIKAGHDENAVAISRGVPKWYKGRRYMKLAPSWNLIKEPNAKVYTRRYYEEVLDKLDPRVVVEEIGENAILLCWEWDQEFCHRHIVADWLRDKLGIIIDEV